MSDVPVPPDDLDAAAPSPLDALLAQRAWVRALARRLVRDADAADEIEQRTWLAAVERPPAHAASARGWLAAALRNAARKLGRSEARRARHEAATPPRREPQRTPDEIVAETELQQVVGRLVLELDEPYRATVLLRWVEGLEPAEIARRQGVPPETVRTRLHRAIAKLRERLDREHRGGRAEWAGAVLLWFRDEGGPAPGAPHVPGTAAAAGGLAMTTTQKVVAAAVALALLALGGAAVRSWTGGGDGAPPPAPAAATGTADATPRPSRTHRAARPGESEGTETAAIPETAGPDHADRERDLAGVVVRRDGTPVAGAEVRAVRHPKRVTDFLELHWYADEARGPATRTARDGTFVLHLAPGDVVTLHVTADGLAPADFDDRSAGGRVRLVLDDGVRLRLVAVAADGAAVAGARLDVRVAEPGGGGGGTRRDATTGADGIAVVGGLPPGGKAWIQTGDAAHGSMYWWDVALPASGEAERRLEFLPFRTIRGRVTDADGGAPIAGARVGMNWTLDHAVTTAADGTYELPGWTGMGTPEMYVVAAGYAQADETVGARSTIDVALSRGFAVAGRAVDAAGEPVPEALVGAIASVLGKDGQRTSFGHAIAGADGRFRIDGLATDMPHVLVVAARGRARARPEIPSGAAGATVEMGDVVLGAPHALAGRVVDPDGRGIEGAAVSLVGPVARDEPQYRDNDYGRRASRRTDDLGRFRFDDLPPGRFTLSVRRDGLPDTERTAEVPDDGDRLDVEIRTAAVRTLAVHVVDEAGRPVAGASVWAYGGSAPAQPVVSGADGVARVAVDPTVRSVAVPNGCDGERPLLPAAETPFPAGATDVTIVLREGARVRVRLLAPDGAPIPHGVVQVTCDAAGTDRSRAAYTGLDGRAALVMPRAPSYDVRFDGIVGSSDSGLGARALGVGAGTETVLRAERIATDRRLRVRVLDPDGAAVAGVHVWLAPVSGAEPRAAVTGDDGTAELSGLPSRDFTLSAAAPAGSAAPRPVVVTPDGQTVEVRLRRAVRIRGRVVDAAGEAVAGAVVVLSRGGEPVLARTSGADGAFSLDVEEDATGPYSLRAVVSNPAFRESDAVDGVAPGAADVVLRLR